MVSPCFILKILIFRQKITEKVKMDIFGMSKIENPRDSCEKQVFWVGLEHKALMEFSWVKT